MVDGTMNFQDLALAEPGMLELAVYVAGEYPPTQRLGVGPFLKQ